MLTIRLNFNEFDDNDNVHMNIFAFKLVQLVLSNEGNLQEERNEHFLARNPYDFLMGEMQKFTLSGSRH